MKRCRWIGWNISRNSSSFRFRVLEYFDNIVLVICTKAVYTAPLLLVGGRVVNGRFFFLPTLESRNDDGLFCVEEEKNSAVAVLPKIATGQFEAVVTLCHELTIF